MWIRSLMLMLAVGCVGAGGVAGEPVAAASDEIATINFHCLNHTSIHVVTCEGSISLFPITVTIEYLYILSDNDISILSDELNDISILDGDILDHLEILNDVETRVLDTFLDKLSIAVTRAQILACTVVGGAQVCK